MARLRRGSAFAVYISGPRDRRRSCAVQVFLPWAKILAEAEFTSAEHFNFPRNPKKRDTTAVVSFFLGAGNEARTRFPASREWLAAIRRTPASPLIRSRLRRGVEAASSPPLFPAQRAGGAPAPCKHFCRGQKSWRRRNLLPLSILISHGIQKKKDTTAVVSFFLGAGNEARTRFPASREWLAAIRRTPASPLIRSRLRRGVEAASSPPVQKTGHPKLDVLFHSGAGNEARTRYLHLGKVALYQMSYARGTRGILPEKHPLVKTLP